MEGESGKERRHMDMYVPPAEDLGPLGERLRSIVTQRLRGETFTRYIRGGRVRIPVPPAYQLVNYARFFLHRQEGDVLHLRALVEIPAEPPEGGFWTIDDLYDADPLRDEFAVAYTPMKNRRSPYRPRYAKDDVVRAQLAEEEMPVRRAREPRDTQAKATVWEAIQNNKLLSAGVLGAVLATSYVTMLAVEHRRAIMEWIDGVTAPDPPAYPEYRYAPPSPNPVDPYTGHAVRAPAEPFSSLPRR